MVGQARQGTVGCGKLWFGRFGVVRLKYGAARQGRAGQARFGAAR